MTNYSVGDQTDLLGWIGSGHARSWRLAAHHTLADAGRVIEVDPAAVLRWERGERRPRGRNVRAYHRYLDDLREALGTAASAPVEQRP